MAVEYSYIAHLHGPSEAIEELAKALTERPGDRSLQPRAISASYTLTSHQKLALASDPAPIIAKARQALNRPEPFPISQAEIEAYLCNKLPNSEQNENSTHPESELRISTLRWAAYFDPQHETAVIPHTPTTNSERCWTILIQEGYVVMDSSIEPAETGYSILALRTGWMRNQIPAMYGLIDLISSQSLPGISVIGQIIDDMLVYPEIEARLYKGEMKKVRAPAIFSQIVLDGKWVAEGGASYSRRRMARQGYPQSLLDNALGPLDDKRRGEYVQELALAWKYRHKSQSTPSPVPEDDEEIPF